MDSSWPEDHSQSAQIEVNEGAHRIGLALIHACVVLFRIFVSSGTFLKALKQLATLVHPHIFFDFFLYELNGCSELRPHRFSTWFNVLINVSFSYFNIFKVSFAILHNSPARGDVALLVEIAGALLVWATLRTVPSVHHVVAESALRTPASFTAVCAAIQLSVLAMATILYRLSPWHPLAKFPGPISYRISSLRSAQVVASGVRHKTVDALHKRYGKFVRLGEWLVNPWLYGINGCEQDQTRSRSTPEPQ